MTQFLRLTLVLAAVAALAAGALAFTYGKTKALIQAKDAETKAKALDAVFAPEQVTSKEATVEIGTDKIEYYEVYKNPGDATPAYYAIVGKGVGYNAGSPLELLVGFSRSGADGEFVVVNWKAVKSEETPGLGEKIKDQKAPAAWTEGGPFATPPPNFDSRTDFQKQFAGVPVSELQLKKDGGKLDGITAATITSRGVIAAIRDAESKLSAALKAKVVGSGKQP